MAQDRFQEALTEAKKIDELLAEFRSGKSETEFSSDEQEMLKSPLLGVPISVKESIKVKGMKNSCGMWSKRDVVAEEDSVVVKNARRFGLIPICTTNIPEATLYWADCQNLVYGRTVNPHDLSRISGASSGGEAALLSAGGSVVGIGSDMAGSLRIPAHFCGICSHKPSSFLVSPVGNEPEILQSRLRLFTLGPMSRYASDLRYLLKCFLSDKDNDKRDTYVKHQPHDIATLRQSVMQKLDESTDLSKLKFYYFNPDNCGLTGKNEIKVLPDYMEAQAEVLDHFRSKFNCQIEELNLDKFLKLALITWNCMVKAAGTIDRDETYVEGEMLKFFEIENKTLEMIKIPLGLSKHTKESILALLIGSKIPDEREKAFKICEKFEKKAAEMKAELEQILGDNGILLLPTMPTVAYKHNVALMKTPDLRFPTLANVCQLPVTHVNLKLDRKNNLPFGVTIAAVPYNDVLTLSVGEEIEQTFGGWVPPTKSQIPLKMDEPVEQQQENVASSNVNIAIEAKM